MANDYDLNYNPNIQPQMPYQIHFGNNLHLNPNNMNNGLAFNPNIEQNEPYQLPQMSIMQHNVQLDYDPNRNFGRPYRLPQMNIIQPNVQLDYDPNRNFGRPYQIGFNIPLQQQQQNYPQQQQQNYQQQQPPRQVPNNLHSQPQILQRNNTLPKNTEQEKKIDQNNIQTNNVPNKGKEEIQNDNKDRKQTKEEDEKKKNNIFWYLLYLLAAIIAITTIIVAIIFLAKLLEKDDKVQQPLNNQPTTTNNTLNTDTNVSEKIVLSGKDTTKPFGDNTVLGEIINEGGKSFDGTTNANDVLNNDINLSQEAKRCILAENQTGSTVQVYKDLDGNGIYTEGIDELLGEGSGFSVDGGYATLYDKDFNKINIKIGDNICAKSNVLGDFSSKDLDLMNNLYNVKDPITGKCYSVLKTDINVDLNINSAGISGNLSSKDINLGNFSTTSLDKNKFANDCVNKFLSDKNTISSLSENQKKLLEAWQKGRDIAGVNSKLNYLQSNNSSSKKNLNSQNNNLQL